MPTTLETLGFTAAFARHLAPDEREPGSVVARVVAEEKITYRVRAADGDAPEWADNGEFWANLAGKFRHTAEDRIDVPAVGDFVLVRPPHSAESRGMVLKLFPRKSLITRTTERGEPQPLAANVDTAFITSSLNNDFNLRRIERYLALVHKSGATPVVVLTKADLVDSPQPWIDEVKSIAPNVAAHPVSAITNQGLDSLRTYLGPGRTAVLLGSSGVGKSTLTNYLAKADLQWMMEIREYDDKGRHCTTKRNLFVLSEEVGGGLLIDTPGLRGLSVTESTDALAATFEDVEALIPQCRFSDCRHETEPGCAVKAAIEAGTLAPDRLEGYMKLQKELAYQRRTKRDIQKQRENTKRLTEQLKKHHKNR
jgi:ribosome biogenesis GTPase